MVEAGTTVAVVGAGVMGAGIAQVAAQAGHPVLLYDVRPDAAAGARRALGMSLEKLVERGKLKGDEARVTLERVRVAGSLEDLRVAGLVIEAVVENLEAKRALLRQLEALVEPNCILASNTSSISLTALANGLAHPGRLVGMHFFNPAPVMKLVEVVSGLHTDPDTAKAVHALAGRWGKTAVHAKSTPGFIVNRIARPFYAETLALLQERAATPAVIDACLRAAGFRMGPCEVMDLIGHDTNFAVTSSVYEANFFDKRYVPSLVQRELVDGGLLGRKSGRGFYAYVEGKPTDAGLPKVQAAQGAVGSVLVHGNGSVSAHLRQVLQRGGVSVEHAVRSDWTGLESERCQVRLTDGRPAGQIAADTGVRDVAVFDRLPIEASAPVIAYALAEGSNATLAPTLLARAGFAPQRVADVPGLVVARTLAMLINEAADAVQQGVCGTDEADTAMKLGTAYPKGPFEWLGEWDATGVVALIRRLDERYRGERYRVSPWLERRAWSAEHIKTDK